MSEVENWQEWRAGREKRLRDPHGTLALIGTHWLKSEPAPIIEGEPVLWSSGPGGRTVAVTAKAEHGIVVDGAPVDGTVVLRTDTDERPQTALVPELDILLVPIERSGNAALRVYDPKSPALTSFDGVDFFDYDPAWALPARFTPYDGRRVEKVLNADGVVRELGVDGTVEFELEDGGHSLQAARDGEGLWIVFADPTTAQSEPSFRFVDIAGIAEDGGVLLDFNRAYLPPCAFADHYVCPVPPPGNVFEAPVRAGELTVRTR